MLKNTCGDIIKGTYLFVKDMECVERNTIVRMCDYTDVHVNDTMFIISGNFPYPFGSGVNCRMVVSAHLGYNIFGSLNGPPVEKRWKMSTISKVERRTEFIYCLRK